MNKFSFFVCLAASIVLAGCVDPNYKRPSERNQVKTVPQVVEPRETIEVDSDVEEITTTKSHCTCAPNTKHTKPCECDADDCKCVVVKPTPVKKPTVEETTPYIVQRGDYLAKISKKYNITIASIRRVNPQLKNDVLKIGQTIYLPGKIDIGAQTVPEGAFAPKPAPVAYTAYSGATKEYVVKAGDTLGAIAYGNGINIRQLKELNGLSSNVIRIGQKLKIPANAPVKEPAKPAEKPVATPAPATPAAPAVEEPKVEVSPETPVVAVQEPEVVAEVVQKEVTYVVAEGEDIINLSIRFNLTPSEIRELNNLNPEDELKPGAVLKLPPDTEI